MKAASLKASAITRYCIVVCPFRLSHSCYTTVEMKRRLTETLVVPGNIVLDSWF